MPEQSPGLFGPEADEIARAALDMPPGSRIVMTQKTLDYLDTMVLSDALQSAFDTDDHGPQEAFEVAEDAVRACTHEIAPPPGYRLVAVCAPDGTRRHGFVPFTAQDELKIERYLASLQVRSAAAPG